MHWLQPPKHTERLEPPTSRSHCALHQSLAHHVAKDQVDGVLGNRSVHSIPNLLAGAAVLGSLESALTKERMEEARSLAKVLLGET